MVEVREGQTTRDAQRLETRERIYKAAVLEFARAGTADADVATIVAAAKVAHGTFYFHFPSKEHVLAELEHREQTRLAGELSRFLVRPHTLPDALQEIVRLVSALDRRLGSLLFRDVLALHFSPKRPMDSDWTENRFIACVIDEMRRAQKSGEVSSTADPYHTSYFLLLGLYALLGASHGSTKSERSAMLASFFQTVLTGLEPRT